MTAYESKLAQATDGLTLTKSHAGSAGKHEGLGVVMVDDGNDRWIVGRRDWNAVVEAMREEEPLGGDEDEAKVDAYTELCVRCAKAGAIASAIGSSRGDYAALVRAAVEADMLDADTARRAYGVVHEMESV